MNGAPSSLVSPGLWGFVAFFVLAIALYLLMRNMNARMRRMSYRSEELDRQAEAEAAERRERKSGGAAPASADGVGEVREAGDGEVREAGDGDAPQEQNGQTH